LIDINPLIKELEGSGIRIIWEKALKTKDAIRMDIGDPDFPPPAKLIYELKKAVDDGYTHYTTSSGMAEAKGAIAQKLKLQNGMNVDPEKEVVITPGASGGLYAALLATIRPGEGVLIPDPGWPQYTQMVRLVGGVPYYYRLDENNDYQIDFNSLENYKNVKLIIVNTPHNPTGSVLNQATLARLKQFVQENDITIISDEAYEAIIFDEKHISIGSWNDMRERTISIFSLSKTLSIPGLRIGYAVAPPEVAEAMSKVVLYTSTCANSLAQRAIIETINDEHPEVKKMIEEYKLRREIVFELLTETNIRCVKPKGTFYLFPNYGELVKINSMEFALKLLDELKVSVVPGSSFGKLGEYHFRLSCTAPLEKIVEGTNRIIKFVNRLLSG